MTIFKLCNSCVIIYNRNKLIRFWTTRYFDKKLVKIEKTAEKFNRQKSQTFSRKIPQINSSSCIQAAIPQFLTIKLYKSNIFIRLNIWVQYSITRYINHLILIIYFILYIFMIACRKCNAQTIYFFLFRYPIASTERHNNLS